MHAVLAWMIGAGYISYQYGWKCGQLPWPKHYIALTGAISLASLVAAWNPTVGGLLGYGMLFGLYLREHENGGPQYNCDKPPDKTSSGTSSTNTIGDIVSNVSNTVSNVSNTIGGIANARNDVSNTNLNRGRTLPPTGSR